MKECLHDHRHCSRSCESRLPKRVLDLGGTSAENHIRLIDGNLLRSQYVALSYCWGSPDKKPNSTTAENLKDRQNKIIVTELVKGFRDAIYVTRALAIRYLWIDSLCIIQDSAFDFASQARKMSTIYSKATVTIAASCSADTHVGFLLSRERNAPGFDIPAYRGPRSFGDWFKVQPTDRFDGRYKEYDANKAYNEYAKTIDEVRYTVHLESLDENTNLPWVFNRHWNEPIQKRAWTLQERFLSPRTVFFDTSQLLWECSTHRYLESSNMPMDPYWNDIFDSKLSNAKQLLRQSQVGQVDPSKLYTMWYEVLDIFGTRRLTYGNDALPAMSGIAKKFALALGDRYMAGLWQKDFVKGLVWWAFDQDVISGYEEKDSQVNQEIGQQAGLQARSESLMAPSWSWASLYRNRFNTDSLVLNGCAVRTYRHFESRFDAEMMAIETVPLFQDPFGQLKLGSLTIRGFSRRLRVLLPGYGIARNSIYSKAFTGFAYSTSTGPLDRDLQIEFEFGNTPHTHLYLDDTSDLREFMTSKFANVPVLYLECVFLSTWSPGENIMTRQVRDRLGISDLRSYCLLLRPHLTNAHEYERCGLLRIDLPWHSLENAGSNPSGDMIERFFQ